MVQHKFTIGNEEKQRIRIDHSATTGKVTIIVNGNRIVVINGRELRPVSHAIDSITIAFNIGEKEKHKINIRIRGRFWNHFEAYSGSELVYRS